MFFVQLCDVKGAKQRVRLESRRRQWQLYLPHKPPGEL